MEITNLTIKITRPINLLPHIYCPNCGVEVEITPMDVLIKFGSVYTYCHNCQTEIRVSKD